MKTFQPQQLDDFREILNSELAKDERVSFAFLHGSAQQGLEFHDLDIAVFLNPVEEPDYSVVGEISEHLEQLLGVPCDVHSVAGAPSLFCFQVSHGDLLCSSDELTLADWREATWNNYFRFQPYQERLLKDWLASS